jgi:predicted GH43/DUF377 family glycosyl hydrolase
MRTSLYCIGTFYVLILLCPLVTAQGTTAGWKKYENNPVLGGDLGTCFDITMLKDGDLYRMWFSWRPKKSIAYVESKNGTTWSEPKIVLSPIDNDWEHDLNRPGIVLKDGVYHMWYTGQANGQSKLGYAVSKDGLVWERQSPTPVLVSEESWEKVAVMCPHVEWDMAEKLFKMWYSGGEQYEPNAIGYATSPDGLKWTKYNDNPIFFADKQTKWEQHKVTACQVVKHDGWYVMFYIGFENEDLARIGIARSKDGITDWQRHPSNPIVFPERDKWDHDACYKPFVLYDAAGKKWRLWYNGRCGGSEQIGMVYHDGEDLGFPSTDAK